MSEQKAEFTVEYLWEDRKGELKKARFSLSDQPRDQVAEAAESLAKETTAKEGGQFITITDIRAM